ncbi:hypothetical protein IID21_04445, partial [Patescibacteria group bacterium]|nr:hypothetical protein [Patescibacteria group bacterium]
MRRVDKFSKIILCVALISSLFISQTASVYAATFTAGMSKRSAPGPFTAAPIVQGDWASTTPEDIISFSKGNLIFADLSDNIKRVFYETFEQTQGSIVFWITPEWDGNDGKEHIIFTAGTQNTNVVKKTTSNTLLFDQGWGSNMSVDISSWVAGTTYNVVVRWDRKNTLDGTNYYSISINDVHSFGNSSIGSNSLNVNNPYVGNYPSPNGENPANAIIEGLTIYRRPLYDGTNGIDVGNGDEIAAIYNSGSGQDPTLTTGSWDVVFALPTNSSVGALSTGTGEAWSHPHSSNLMYDTTTDTGGFMLNGTYTTDSWADEGTPSTVAALATGEKIFAGGYKTTSDAVDEGIYYSETVTAGDDWVIRALGHSDGTCDPKVILYDQTGTAEIGSLTGTTTSDRDTPDVYLFTGEAPTSSTELRVKLINTAASGTCFWHQVELLANEFTN